jgi:hypothetical protein
MTRHLPIFACTMGWIGTSMLVGACQSVGSMQDFGTGGRASGGRVGSGGVAAGGTSATSNPGTGGAVVGGSTTAGLGGSGGKTGAGGTTNTGGTTSTGGTTGAGSTTGTSACPAMTSATMAMHMIINVTWPATLGASGGSGKFHIWSMDKLALSGNTLTGKSIPCGNTVPEITLASIVGGGKVEIEVPMSFWDVKPALEFPLSGTTPGWAPGGSITQTGNPALVGVTMSDPNATWPSSYTSVTAADVDKDNRPGLLGIPKSTSGYVNPPVSIVGALGPRADKVDLGSRTTIDIQGSFTSCTEHSGKATAKHLDNHVVGCHLAGADECSAAQVKFLDDNRTVYTISGGTYLAKMVSDNATCADVRAALPE